MLAVGSWLVGSSGSRRNSSKVLPRSLVFRTKAPHPTQRVPGTSLPRWNSPCAPPQNKLRPNLFTPGIYTDDQAIGWRKVTEAVRSAGGQMFIQLMHAGRISHPANTPHGTQAVAPSAVKKCYLKPKGIDHLHPFLPLLKEVAQSAQFLLAVIAVLNLLEVAPRPGPRRFTTTAVCS
jgi:hypothetical protein